MSRSFGGRSLTIRSPIVISPAVISSSPATIRSVVDLPHPEGPTSTTNSLSRMWRFTSLTACTSSYFLFRSFIITWAMHVSPCSECRDGTPGRPQRASAFHGPGEAGDIVLDEEGVNESDRDRAQQRPVDERALLQLFRDRLEVPHHQPRAKRDEEGRIGQDERPRCVAEPEVTNDVGERDEEERGRHEVGHEDARAEAPRQREAEPGQRVAGQEPAEERDHRGNDRDEHRVPEPGREHRLLEEIEHVLDGGRSEEHTSE